MAISITISITQNSQNIANNTSNVTVKVNASWTGGSYNLLQKSGWLQIDGTTYNFTSSFNTSRTTSGTQNLFTKTVNVTHDSTGAKTLACKASYTSGVSSGTVGASVSKALTTIPRKSTLAASNGMLGTAQKLTVTRQATSFTHTITYKCGTASGTVCTKSSSTSITWTPPLSLASQNTTGTSVSITFTITTYNSSTSVGSNTKTISCGIPSSVKPSCSISVSDPTGYSSTYGGYVMGLSKFKVTVTAAQSYSSPIASYKTTANGSSYTNAAFTTDVLKTSGTLTISATVTDKRGRTGSSSKTITVIGYSAPIISKLSVKRCNQDGSDNDKGEYVQVTFSATVTSLSQKNSAAYSLRYKRTNESTYTNVALDKYTGVYSVVNGTLVFPADSGNSYNVELTVADKHNTTRRATSASTGFTLVHWNAAGNGMGVGKVSELQNVLDIGMQTRFAGGILYTLLEPETDLNEVRTPGFYVGENVSDYVYAHCPIASGTFTLEVLSGGDSGQLLQRFTRCHKTDPSVYERFYYTSAWSEWTGGWIYPTLNSAFTMYGTSATDNQPRYRKDGRVVEVRGIVTPTYDIAGSTTNHTIFTLTEAYRPSSPIYIPCQGSGNCIWLLRVASNGEVSFSRYRNGDTTATAAAGAWLPFQVTYLAK